MRTQGHWDLCRLKISYIAAQNFALQLKEYARQIGYNPHGVKLLDKQAADYNGSIADAQVCWIEGPDNWAKEIECKSILNVCIEVENSYTISFYDI